MFCPSPKPGAPYDPEGRVEAVIAAHTSGHVVIVAGREFAVHADVFDPTIAPSGEIGMCITSLPWARGRVVADIGAGSGIFSCLFALNGARKVIATDVSDTALANIRDNVTNHRLGDLVEVRRGQGLAAIDAADGVEIVYCDLPFNDARAPDSELEAAFYDVGLSAISGVLHDFSTRSDLSTAYLYLCTSSLSHQWESHIAFSRNLSPTKVLALNRDWIELELWRILRTVS